LEKGLSAETAEKKLELKKLSALCEFGGERNQERELL
jgi:hypothetical protein